MKSWAYKDPDEILDYGIDWLGTATDPGRLYDTGGDTIASSLWIIPTGLTQTTDTQTSTQTVVWLSGGTIGEKYVVTNRIVTAAGRTFDQSVKLKVKAR